MSRSSGTYALVSLGCPKNLVDSERMAGLLRGRGYRLVDEPAGADFVVVNTCGFIDQARDESLGVVEEMAQLKREGQIRGLIVTGCLAQRDREKLLAAFPEIDQLLGVFARDEISTAADRLAEGMEPAACFRAAPAPPLVDTGRLRLTPPHLAFLKISEGCNRRCSFCTIPGIRGPYASKPIEQVVAEAEELAAEGTRELVVIAQDTSYYGVDLYGEPRLAEVLQRLAEVEGIAWIRPMYLYPTHMTDHLIDVLAAGGKVVPYLDIPLQHINDDVLRRMRRGTTRVEIERLIDRLRERIDDLVLRTTLIVGFPGETESQSRELEDFVRRVRFERLGVFAYRNEPGTHAATLDGQLPEEIKTLRRDRLMALQQKIAFDWAEQQIGRTLDVLIDRDIPGEKHAWLGRTYADAPEVDALVYVTGEKLVAGDIVPCEVVARQGYDLIAVGADRP